MEHIINLITLSNRNLKFDYLRKYNRNTANQNDKGDNNERKDFYFILVHVTHYLLTQ